MSTLTRYAGPLALLAGVIWVIVILIQIVAPNGPTWIGLFPSVLLIGGAALGLQRRIGARTGRLGRGGAAATAVGSVAFITVVLFSLATGQFDTSTPPPPILRAFLLSSFFLWFLGSLVFAVGLIRAKAIEPIGGWLIVLGALATPLPWLIAGGQNPDPLPVTYLPLVLYGIGWVLVGYAARTPAPDLGLADQAS